MLSLYKFLLVKIKNISKLRKRTFLEFGFYFLLAEVYINYKHEVSFVSKVKKKKKKKKKNRRIRTKIFVCYNRSSTNKYLDEHLSRNIVDPESVLRHI